MPVTACRGCGLWGKLIPFPLAATFGMVFMSMTAQMTSASDFTATPLSGQAPLEITFTGKGSGDMEGEMLLDFGDGDTDNSISTIRGFTRTHTYTVPGTYTAQLKSGAHAGREPATLMTVGSVEITVN